MSALTEQIDTLSEACCKKMPKIERAEFFRYQKEFRASGLAYKKQYYPGGESIRKHEKKRHCILTIQEALERREKEVKAKLKEVLAQGIIQDKKQITAYCVSCTMLLPIRGDGTQYHKGKRVGKLRDVYEVDGVIFNRVWNLLQPYAMTSVSRSYFHHSWDESQEDLADIKMQLFYIMRFFGPKPSGRRMSQFFKTLVSNVLTSSAYHRGLPSKNRVYCSHCDKFFLSTGQAVTKEHKDKGHRVVPVAEAIGKFYCGVCKKLLSSEIEAKRHRARGHNVKEISEERLERGTSGTRVLFEAESLSKPVDANSGATLGDTLPDTSAGCFDEPVLNIPPHLQEIATEVCNGMKFSEVVRAKGLSPKEVRKIKKQFAEVLHYRV